MNKIKDLIHSFSHISFEYTYREYNKETDMLSKDALQEQEGSIIYQIFQNSKMYEYGLIKLYKETDRVPYISNFHA